MFHELIYDENRTLNVLLYTYRNLRPIRKLPNFSKTSICGLLRVKEFTAFFRTFRGRLQMS